MRYIVTHDDAQLEIDLVARDDGRFDVTLGDRSVIADQVTAGGRSLFTLLLDRSAYEVNVARTDGRYRVALRGHDVTLLVESEQERNARLVDGAPGGTGPHTVKSVMPGRVVKILVREGEAVAAGTPLLILEAMKMENEIRAHAEGTVARVLVSEGATVGNGDALVTIA